MFQSSVLYGSPQLPVVHSNGFALAWVEQLAMQSEELNVEHESVLQKLNSLLHALNSGEPTGIAMACSAMSAEARAHFAKEEELMLAADYPDGTTHIEQHEELMRRLARIGYAVTYATGFWSPANELSMLEQWFVPHLSYADRRFADFIATRGATGRRGLTAESVSADSVHG